MVKKVLLISSIVIVLGLVLFFAIDGSATKESENKTVAVERGSIIDQALAVGRIEPKQEIAVKSKISGIVKKTYAEIGDQVKVGDPLFDIAPDPTPIEYAEAKRQVEINQVSYANAKRELDRSKTLMDKKLISNQEYDNKQATCDEAELRLKLATEKLSLIESGSTTVADRNVDNVIKAPINGMVLSRLVEEGDPVVPLTSYQAGTELMTLARMDDLVFKGNVDEIDVGKIKEGMEAELEIGALTSADKIQGVVKKISPKAHTEDGSTLFEVEIAITDLGNTLLRAGYSANAEVIITKKEDIIVVPERLVHIKDSVSYVEVQDSLLVITEREIETGLSDGMNIEVISGLDVGELVVERPPKEVNVWD